MKKFHLKIWEVLPRSMKSKVAHFAEENDAVCLRQIRALCRYIPQNCEEKPLRVEPKKPDSVKAKTLNELIRENPNKPYDIKNVINGIVDKDSLFEVHAHYADNIVVGFVHIDGRSVGIMANQPLSLAGV